MNKKSNQKPDVPAVNVDRVVMPEIWDRIHFSCNRKIFEGKKVHRLTPDELDEICRAEGILWEKCGKREIHIHACGFECDCHGGRENRRLRPKA